MPMPGPLDYDDWQVLAAIVLYIIAAVWPLAFAVFVVVDRLF